MKIIFYSKKNGQCPVRDFILSMQLKDKAKVLACLKSIEDLGFASPRVEFRQIDGRLWEIKIKTFSAGFRIFYVKICGNVVVLLHCYKKQTQKAPAKEILIAEKRMLEVIDEENNHT